jgi:two-component system sensor histidine kinase ChvG
MPALAIVGPSSGHKRRIRRIWSLTVKTRCLALIFALVPFFLYLQFRDSYEDSQALLLRSVREQGRTISQFLLPILKTTSGTSFPQLGEHLAQFAGTVTTIKLLFAPAGSPGGSFYYVASWPTVKVGDLTIERRLLAERGVLERLSQSCRGEIPFSLIYHRPKGGAEIVTAVTPESTPAGCWAVVASFSGDAFPSMHLGQPYWATPNVQIAAAVYLAMVVITFSTLFSIDAGLRRFTARARAIRENGPSAGGFAGSSQLPELAEVAAEFDRMVEGLHRSAAAMRRAAEDNAHTFKVPIAVIRQATEPLHRVLPPENQRAHRALRMIESSLDRLDGLVASARRLDEADADLIAEPRLAVDIEPIIRNLVHGYSAIPSARGVSLQGDLQPDTLVLATEEMIERIMENLVENAMSFSPAGGDVAVRLVREDGTAHITVSDQGPGVPATELGRIFDRYYSERHAEETGESPPTYFGIGLSIVRRNVDAIGGAVEAENRAPHGLVIHVRLPLAQAPRADASARAAS